jgi:3-oxoacyl-[acyl-carrier protein] reductase
MINNEKLALVTGASRGIGRAILAALAKTGITVVGTATSIAGADAITDFITSQGFKGKGFVLDVTDSVSINTLFEEIRNTYDKMPAILVNNAGITRDNLMLRMKDEEWDSIIQTNLSAVYHVTKACLRDMVKQRWGRIVNISSISAFMGNPGQANYAAAKAGLVGFTKSLAAEVASRGITCNVVAPGFIDTDMTQALSEAHRQKLCDNIPMGRVGNPEEIAAVVAFMVSDLASYVTGETLHVNGGLYMH